MRKFLLIPILLLALSGCATTPVSNTATAVQQAQNASLKSVEAMGATLQAVPAICEALYNAGKIDKATYNNDIVPIYNRAIGSYKLLTEALDAAIAAGKDPNQVSAYTLKLAAFTLDNQNLSNLMLAMQGKQIGEGTK